MKATTRISYSKTLITYTYINTCLTGGCFFCGVEFGRVPSGRAIRFKSSPFVPHGCGLSAAIPHAAWQYFRFNFLILLRRVDTANQHWSASQGNDLTVFFMCF